MAQIITMEDGLQMMKRAFPKDKKLFSDCPVLSTVYTGCEKAIPFCLVSNIGGSYYVREIISGRAYKTSKLIYREMRVGDSYSNMTVVNQNGKLAAGMVKNLNV